MANLETSTAAIQSFSDAYLRFLTYCDEAAQLVLVTERGAKMIVGVNDLGDMPVFKPLFAESDIPAMSVTAKRLLEQNLSLANAHALMGIWGSLESTVDDLCVNWLIYTEGSEALKALSKIKVVLGEYLAVPGEDRWSHVFEVIKRERASSLKHGAGQFESLFDAVGLGGALDPDLKHSLQIMKAVRNLLAHRAGRVDQLFLEQCPVTQAVAGERLVITYENLTVMIGVAIEYLRAIEDRRTVYFGFPIEKRLSPLGGQPAEQLAKLKNISSVTEAAS